MKTQRPGFKQTQIGLLPDDWQASRLGDEGLVHRIGSGITPTGGQKVYTQSRRPCLEYILVHEMVHLLERHHNDRFLAYMNDFLPQWRLHREELSRAPLAHED